MNYRILSVFFGTLILSGCAATSLVPGAERVRLTNTEPAGCQFLGEVEGSQGNMFSGQYTANSSLETGARNE